MLLSVKERLLILGVLPHEGDVTTLKIIRDLKQSLGFSEDEYKALAFKQTNNQVTWTPQTPAYKDFLIGEKATDIIVGSLKHLADAKKLGEHLLALYERLVDNVEDNELKSFKAGTKKKGR